MHASVMQFVTRMVRELDLVGKDVLEIGSLDVNGSVRPLFGARTYLGTDMRPGPGVDLVVNAHSLVAERVKMVGEWDVVVCCEMLEHDDRPWDTLDQALLMTKPGGVLILTARGYDQRASFPYHGYPDDYWRYTPTGMSALLRHTGWTPVTVVPDYDRQSPGVFAVALSLGGST